MATLDVSIPDKLKDWVEAQAGTGHYLDAGDYVRDLIRRDRERAQQIIEIQGLIDEGLASGVSERSMEEVLDIARRRAGVIVGE